MTGVQFTARGVRHVPENEAELMFDLAHEMREVDQLRTALDAITTAADDTESALDDEGTDRQHLLEHLIREIRRATPGPAQPPGEPQ